MKVSSLFLFSLLLSSFVFAQNSDSSLYKNLPVKKDYNFTVSFNPQIALYKVNNQKVDKETYYKFLKIKEDAESCCPCLIKTYDAQEKLLREDVLCGDCNVGKFIVYNEDGSTKAKGQFKENDSGDWTNIYARGYCGVPDGKWIFYNKHGQPKYVELWEDGEFKKQIPEQKKAEIWKLDLILYDSVFLGKSIPINQIKNLQFKPHFKSKHTSVDLRISVEISNGKHFVSESFTPLNFSSIDVEKSLAQLKAIDPTNPQITIQVYFDHKLISISRLDIK